MVKYPVQSEGHTVRRGEKLPTPKTYTVRVKHRANGPIHAATVTVRERISGYPPRITREERVGPTFCGLPAGSQTGVGWDEPVCPKCRPALAPNPGRPRSGGRRRT